MRIKKIVLGEQPECYGAGFVRLSGQLCPIVGSEGHGPCYAYVGDHYSPEMVSPGPGGMACVYSDLDVDNFFLASQNFFPDFHSNRSAIVQGARGQAGEWQLKELVKLPFAHRFCTVASQGVTYFVVCTICARRAHPDDWSHPGAVYACQMGAGPLPIAPILQGIHQNHGMWKGTYEGRPAVYITGMEGVFVLEPPGEAAAWRVTQLMAEPVSEISACDIDGDGQDEYALIQPFHGDDFRVVKGIGDHVETLYQYGGDVDFLHVSWGGQLLGRPAFIGSCRRKGKELFVLRWDAGAKAMVPTVIDRGGGAASISVAHRGECAYIAAANRESGQAVVYELRE